VNEWQAFFRFFDLNGGAVVAGSPRTSPARLAAVLAAPKLGEGGSPAKTLRDCSRHGWLYSLRGWRGLL